MAFKVIKFKDHDEWLILRMKGIGGSDASCCLNKNPFKSMYELYRDKKGLINDDEKKQKDEKISNNPRVIYGKNAEAPIREIFKLDYSDTLQVANVSDKMFIRTDKPYMFGNVDGLLNVVKDFKITSYWKKHYNVDEECPKPKLLTKGMIGVLEIKTSEVIRSIDKEKWDNRIPDNYYCQCLHYLNVLGCDFFVLRVQLTFVDENGIKTHSVRDYCALRSEIEEDLIMVENGVDNFWNNYYLKDIEPPLLNISL